MQTLKMLETLSDPVLVTHIGSLEAQLVELEKNKAVCLAKTASESSSAVKNVEELDQRIKKLKEEREACEDAGDDFPDDKDTKLKLYMRLLKELSAINEKIKGFQQEIQSYKAKHEKNTGININSGDVGLNNAQLEAKGNIEIGNKINVAGHDLNIHHHTSNTTTTHSDNRVYINKTVVYAPPTAEEKESASDIPAEKRLQQSLCKKYEQCKYSTRLFSDTAPIGGSLIDGSLINLALLSRENLHSDKAAGQKTEKERKKREEERKKVEGKKAASAKKNGPKRLTVLKTKKQKVDDVSSAEVKDGGEEKATGSGVDGEGSMPPFEEAAKKPHTLLAVPSVAVDSSSENKNEEREEGQLPVTTTLPVSLTELFDCKDDDSQPPKFLLVEGPAGIGKTTLCQFLVAEWASAASGEALLEQVEPPTLESKNEKLVAHYLHERFDAVFLLNLKETAANIVSGDMLAGLIHRFCLQDASLQGSSNRLSKKELENYLTNKAHKILFILDGYDEVIGYLGKGGQQKLDDILSEVTDYGCVLVTSRPTSINTLGSRRTPFDRRLQIRGFSEESNILNYIQRFMEEAEMSEKAESLFSFLKLRPNILKIARTPINLELLCCLWLRGRLDAAKGQTITTSKLYQTIVTCMWQVHTKTLGAGRPAALSLSDQMENKREGGTVADRVNEFLENLAYSAMRKGVLQTIPSLSLSVALEKTLTRHKHPDDDYHQEQLLVSTTDKSCFLRPIKERGAGSQLDQDHYFIHLSFQEFYAAKYIARVLSEEPDSQEGHDLIEHIRTEKYTPRYQLMLGMSAGLLYQQGRKNRQLAPLERFWKMILSLPIDIIGPAHHELVMNCLNECEMDEQLVLHKTLLKQRLKYLAQPCHRDQILEQVARYPILFTSPVVIAIAMNAFKKDDSQKMAFQVLASLNNPGEAVTRELMNALHRNSDMRTVFSELSSPSESIIQALADRCDDQHEWALELLSRLNKPNESVIQALIRAAKSQDSSISTIAITALGNLKEADKNVVQVLMDALKSPHNSTRLAAVIAIDKLDNFTQIKNQALIHASADKDIRVKEIAVNTLSQLNDPDDDVVQALRHVLEEPEQYVLEGSEEEVLKSVEKMLAAAGQALGKLDKLSIAEIERLLAVLSNHPNNSAIKNRAVIEALSGVIGSDNRSDKLDLNLCHALLNTLQNEDIPLRQAAIKALGKLNSLTKVDEVGVLIIPALLGLVHGEQHTDIKTAAIEVLAKTNDPLRTAPHVPLQDAMPNRADAREASVEGSVEETKVPRSPSSLERAGDVGIEVAEISGEPKNLDRVTKALQETLEDKKSDVKVREAAVKGLGELKNLPTSVIRVLQVMILKDSDPEVREAGVKVLGGLKTLPVNTVRVLREVVSKDPTACVKKVAIEVFGNLNNPDKSIVHGLLKALKDEDTDVKMAAIYALSQLKNPTEDAIEKLKESSEMLMQILLPLNSDFDSFFNGIDDLKIRKKIEAEVQQKIEVVVGLKNLGINMPHILQNFLENKKEDLTEFMAAVLAVRLITKSDEWAVLEPVLQDQNVSLVTIQYALILSLYMLEDPNDNAIKIMVNLATTVKAKEEEGYSFVRYVAIQALVQLGESRLKGPNNGITTVLKDIVLKPQHDLWQVKCRIIEKLSKLGDPDDDFIRVLKEASKDKDEDVRRLAIETLGELKEPGKDVIKVIQDAFTDKDRNVRNAVINALAKLKNLDNELHTIAVLKDAVKDKKEDVRYSAIKALGQLRNPDDDVIKVLVGALKDQGAQNRDQAAQALLSVTRTDNHVKIVLKQLKEKRQCAAYFSACFERKDLLWCIDHKKGQLITSLDGEIRHVLLPLKQLQFLEEQIIAVAKEKGYEPSPLEHNSPSPSHGVSVSGLFSRSRRKLTQAFLPSEADHSEEECCVM